MRLSCAVLVLCAAACAPPQQVAPAAPVVIERVWMLEGLASPESVIASADPTVLYVANVNGEGEAKDGNGFIARVSREGRLLQREWVTGLNGPKGMALRGGALFVSDIDQLVEIDAAAGAIRARYPGGSFLNDVALLADGTVLAADSAGARIYALRDGRLQEWLADPLLDSVNGLSLSDGKLIVTTMQGRLLSIDPTTKAITTLATDLGEADGVAALGGGAYLVTEWPGRLFQVNANGRAHVLLDTRGRDILLNDILLVEETLYVPNWTPGSLTAYRVVR